MKSRCSYLFGPVLFIFVLGPLAFAAPDDPVRAQIIMPAGRSITVDGKLSPGEWSDAASMSIDVAPGWRVRVLFKHDASNLYFAFTHLTRGKDMRFPELLFDPREQRSDAWQPGEWWLHSSFNLCEGNGEYNLYDRNGIFQCARTKQGWSANHFPLATGGVMEIQVSFSKLGLKPVKDARFGFAIDLTDTQKKLAILARQCAIGSPEQLGRSDPAVIDCQGKGALANRARV